MPNIRYHEYRPGRWVKVVDGQAVGPATDEEVAAWKREVQAQSSIWDDVVKAAGPVAPAKRAPEPEAIEVPWPPPARGLPRPETPDDQGTPSTDALSGTGEAVPRGSTAEAADSASVSRLLRTVEEIRAAKRMAKPGARRPARARASEASPVPAEAETKGASGVTAPAAQAAPPVPTEAALHAPDLPKSLPAEPTPAVAEAAEAQAASAETFEAPGAQVEAVQTSTRAAREQLESAAVPQGAIKAEVVPTREEEEYEGESAVQAHPRTEPAAKVGHGQEAAAPELEEAIALTEELADVELEPEAISLAADVEESALVLHPESSSKTREVEAAEYDAEAVQEEPPGPGRGHAPPAAQRRAVKTQTRAPRTRERKGHVYVWFEAAPADDLVAAVRAGMAKYKERFAQAAGVVLCHSTDLPTLEQAGLGLDVRQGKNVPPRNFWIGPK